MANERTGFSSTHPFFLVMNEHKRTSAAHQRAAGLGPLTPVLSSERLLGAFLSPTLPTGTQVTLSLLRCSSVPVPGAKKGNPLLLKIHFKLSSPSSPREMTKQTQ